MADELENWEICSEKCEKTRKSEELKILIKLEIYKIDKFMKLKTCLIGQ